MSKTQHILYTISKLAHMLACEPSSKEDLIEDIQDFFIEMCEEYQEILQKEKDEKKEVTYHER